MSDAKPTIQEVKDFIRTLNTWFTVEDDELDPLSFGLSTREHGDVGEEMPGRADIDECNRIYSKLREKFPSIKCHREVVDEWVWLTVKVLPEKIEVKPTIPTPTPKPKPVEKEPDQVLIRYKEGHELEDVVYRNIAIRVWDTGLYESADDAVSKGGVYRCCNCDSYREAVKIPETLTRFLAFVGAGKPEEIGVIVSLDECRDSLSGPVTKTSSTTLKDLDITLSRMCPQSGIEVDVFGTWMQSENVIDAVKNFRSHYNRFEPKDTAQAFFEIQSTNSRFETNTNELALALFEGLGLPPVEFVKVLKSLDGIKIPPEAMASVLNEAGLGIEDTVKALTYGLNCDADQIARTLSPALFTAAEVARTLLDRDYYGLFKNEVALVLYSPEGLGLDAEEVAKIFHSPEGLGYDVETVSCVLRDALDLGPLAAAHALEESGVSGTEIVRALKDQYGMFDAAIVDMLIKGEGWEERGVVNAFKGLGFTEQQIEDLFVEITDPKPPPTYKSASQIRAAKNTSKKGIK